MKDKISIKQFNTPQSINGRFALQKRLYEDHTLIVNDFFKSSGCNLASLLPEGAQLWSGEESGRPPTLSNLQQKRTGGPSTGRRRHPLEDR